MFDIGFWELVVVGVVGLLVLGPERLPVAVRTVSRLLKTVRDTANSVKAELSQELRMEELHRDLKKAEQLDIKHLSPELKQSVDQLREAAASVTRPYAKQMPKAKPIPEAESGLMPGLTPELAQNLAPDAEQHIQQAAEQKAEQAIKQETELKTDLKTEQADSAVSPSPAQDKS